MSKPLIESLEDHWTEPPCFPERDDAKLSKFVVYEGVMKIQFNDTDNRILIIPLENVEYIDRVWFYLTFHMKSGSHHTIYVGSTNDSSTNDLAKWIISQFAIFTTEKSKLNAMHKIGAQGNETTENTH